LGDDERALAQFLEAEKSAALLATSARSSLDEHAGYVYRDDGDLPRATESYARRSRWLGRSTVKKTSSMPLKIWPGLGGAGKLTKQTPT